MKRIPVFLIAFALFAACFASDFTDRRPPWDAIKLVSFNRGDSTDLSWCLQTPTVTGVTYPSGYRIGRFDGVDDWISYPDLVDQRAYPLTVMFWFNMQGNDQVQYASLVDKYSTGSLNGWQIFTYDDEKIYAYYLGQSLSNCIYGGGVSALATPSAYKTAGWHHCVVTFATAGGEIYIDGASVDTQAWTGIPTASTGTHRLGIGQHNFSGGKYYKGDLDDLRIYNRELSGNEIAAIYAEGLGVSRP